MARHSAGAREAGLIHMTTALKTQREIHDAERRLQASIRRLERKDLVAPPKRSRNTAAQG